MIVKSGGECSGKDDREEEGVGGGKGRNKSVIVAVMAAPHIFLGFENEPFFPGQEVTGVLVMVVTEPVKAVSLEVRWYGEGDRNCVLC